MLNAQTFVDRSKKTDCLTLKESGEFVQSEIAA
jgi:hypothetical protein